MSGESFFVFLAIAAKGCWLSVTIKKLYLTIILYLLHFTSNTISGKENLICLYKQAENISEILLLNYCLEEILWCDLISTAYYKQSLHNSQSSLWETHQDGISWMDWMPSPLQISLCILPLTEPSSFPCGIQIAGVSDLAVWNFISTSRRNPSCGRNQRHLKSVSIFFVIFQTLLTSASVELW